jgi:hypothetical protein
MFSSLGWWPSRFRHVLCHRSLADIDPELNFHFDSAVQGATKRSLIEGPRP